jgi:hypothetical protein
MSILEKYFTFDNWLKVPAISGRGYYSFMVPWLRFQELMHSYSDCSFFLTKSIGSVVGENDGYMNPVLELSSSYFF